MIVPMKKLTLLVSALDRENALEKLRELGVVHIHPLKSIDSPDSAQLEEEAVAIQKTLDFLPHHQTDKKCAMIDKPVQEIAEYLLGLQKKKEEILLSKEETYDKLVWFEEWGKVSLKSIQEITDSGLYIRFYIAPVTFLSNLPEDKHIFTIKQDKSVAHIKVLNSSRLRTVWNQKILFHICRASYLKIQLIR
jgi:V/A-type H+-transporting ATPase subunit I